MTTADLILIYETIQKHGDDFWNDPNDDNGKGPPSRVRIIGELLHLLAEDDLDLKIVRKK